MFYVKINSKLVYSNDLAELKNDDVVLTIDAIESENISLVIGIKCLENINLEEYGIYSMLNINFIKVKDTQLMKLKTLKLFK